MIDFGLKAIDWQQRQRMSNFYSCNHCFAYSAMLWHPGPVTPLAFPLGLSKCPGAEAVLAIFDLANCSSRQRWRVLPD